MALTGKLTYKGLDIDNAVLKVMQIHHRAVDTSTEAEDGTVTWTKANHADYSARVYKDASSYAADPDAGIYCKTNLRIFKNIRHLQRFN